MDDGLKHLLTVPCAGAPSEFSVPLFEELLTASPESVCGDLLSGAGIRNAMWLSALSHLASSDWFMIFPDSDDSGLRLQHITQVYPGSISPYDKRSTLVLFMA